MRHWDIAIVGGGLAGSIAAAVLGRRGIDVVLVDPHRVYPRDFRCEKLDRFQVGMLHRLGLGDTVLRAATYDKNVWIAQFGMLLDKKPSHQYGIPYDTLVNAVRAEVPAGVKVIHAKALSASTGPVSQRLALSNGEEIEARLIVMASGMGNRLRRDLGIARLEVSPCHSLTVGFDLKPTGRAGF